jgi:hypothetical protein
MAVFSGNNPCPLSVKFHDLLIMFDPSRLAPDASPDYSQVVSFVYGGLFRRRTELRGWYRRDPILTAAVECPTCDRLSCEFYS